MPLLVRRLKVSDLPTLEKIESEHLKRWAGRKGWMATFRRAVERTLDDEPEGMMIADLDGEVVGCAIARQRGEHPMSGLKFGHIFHISVAPEHQEQGIGLRLLKECEAYLRSRGCEVVHLSLPSDDPSAAELFKKSGYKHVAWELERHFTAP